MHPNETAINDYVDGTLRRRSSGAPSSGTSRPARRAGSWSTISARSQRVDRRARAARAAGAGVGRGSSARSSSEQRPTSSARRPPSVARRRRRRAAGATRGTSACRGSRPRRCSCSPRSSACATRPAGDQPRRDGRRRRRSRSASATPAQAIEVGAAARRRATTRRRSRASSRLPRADQGALDPRTAATLQKNLAVIDQAISESRAALRAQPASEPAQQSLIENFKTKIALLQDTVALINEMRKGNDAGAARIVSGLKQKGNSTMRLTLPFVIAGVVLAAGPAGGAGPRHERIVVREVTRDGRHGARLPGAQHAARSRPSASRARCKIGRDGRVSISNISGDIVVTGGSRRRGVDRGGQADARRPQRAGRRRDHRRRPRRARRRARRARPERSGRGRHGDSTVGRLHGHGAGVGVRRRPLDFRDRSR